MKTVFTNAVGTAAITTGRTKQLLLLLLESSTILKPTTHLMRLFCGRALNNPLGVYSDASQMVLDGTHTHFKNSNCQREIAVLGQVIYLFLSIYFYTHYFFCSYKRLKVAKISNSLSTSYFPTTAL